jgi:hypothetical protein
MLFKLKIMSEGDQVLNCWDDKIAIRRANGEVDIFQILIEENDLPRLSDDIWRITYGNNTIEITDKDKTDKGKGKSKARTRKNTKDTALSSENGTAALNESEDDEEDFVISIRHPKQG